MAKAKAKSTKKAQSNPLKQNSLPNWIVLLVILVPVAVVSYLYMSGQVLRPQDLLGAANVAEAGSGSAEAGGYTTIWHNKGNTYLSACTYVNKSSRSYGLQVIGATANTGQTKPLYVYNNGRRFIDGYVWNGSPASRSIVGDPGNIKFELPAGAHAGYSKTVGYFSIRAC